MVRTSPGPLVRIYLFGTQQKYQRFDLNRTYRDINYKTADFFGDVSHAMVRTKETNLVQCVRTQQNTIMTTIYKFLIER